MNEEKPIGIVLPTWNPDEPRFIIADCPKCDDDRQFKNGESVYNQRLGFSYSVSEIVEVLNKTSEQQEKQEMIISKLLPTISLCNKYHIPLEDLPATLEEYIAKDNEDW